MSYNISTNTLFVGQQCHWLPQCGSSNALAAKMAKDGELKEGAVVLCHHQTAGRGQQGNSWEAEAGQNLTCSFYFQPHFLPPQQGFALGMAVALAVWHTVQAQLPGQPVLLKWPNDVLVGHQKIAGILIENTVNTRLESSIVGIGLNVNQARFAHPQATSLALLGAATTVAQVLGQLCQHLEAAYLQLRAGQQALLHQQYEERLLGTNQAMTYALPSGQLLLGTVQGVEASGHLLLHTSSGTQRFATKEISLLL